jgi:transposase-like protein
MIRDKNIIFRASEREADALKELARIHSVTPSELLRDLLRKAARQAGLLPELPTEEPTNELAIAA